MLVSISDILVCLLLKSLLQIPLFIGNHSAGISIAPDQIRYEWLRLTGEELLHGLKSGVPLLSGC